MSGSPVSFLGAASHNTGNPAAEWLCSCGHWNSIRKAFCGGCGKFWQAPEGANGWLVIHSDPQKG